MTPLNLDLWNTTRNTGFLFEPLSVAIDASSSVNMRRVVNAASPRNPATPGAPTLGLPALDRSMTSLVAYPSKALRARRAIQRFYADGERRLIHVTMASPLDLIYLPVVKKTGATVLMTVHDATQHPGEESVALKHVMDRAHTMADHVVALSSYVRDELVRLNEFKQPIHAMPNGLLMDLEPPPPARTMPEGRPLRLLAHGRIKKYKGVDLLIEAMRLLPAMGVRVDLTIAGAGDGNLYVSRVASLPNVTLIPRRTTDAEKRSLYASHDVNIVPYLEASQSAVALDGLSASIPSIATPVGALPEQLADGQNALFASEISPRAVASCIARLAGDRVLYAKLSSGARQAALRYDPKRIADSWIDLYGRILEA